MATYVPTLNVNEALQQLLEGNQRYCNAQAIYPHLTGARRAEVAQGQKPFALIFSCVDSRVPPELVFDQGLGDLFVIRTAGHVLDRAAFGSIEFGVAELGIGLLMVLGHERCGAVAATIAALAQHEEAPGHIQALVEGIMPAVEQVRGRAGELLHNTIEAHVGLTIQRLKTSPIVRAALDQDTLTIVGARYRLDTGAVELLPDMA